MKTTKLTILAITLILFSHIVQAAPSNNELYKMILDIQKEQQKLSNELQLSKQREVALEQELKATKEELKLAQNDLKEIPSTFEPQMKKEETLKEGFKVSAGTVYTKPSFGTERTGHMTTDYMAGFQVSANYQASNNWDYGIKYQGINSNSTSAPYSRSGVSQNGELPLPPVNYKLNYNLVDLELGKYLKLSDSLMMRLSGGLRYMSLVQAYSFNFSQQPLGINSVMLITEPFSSSTWGVGPRVTASPVWKPFDKNFRIFGNFGFSALAGSQTYKNNGLDFNTDEFYSIVDTGAGIGYTIKNNLIDIDLEAGYQYENWVNNSSIDASPSFRGMHGTYGTIGINF
ncbi:MAG: Lpg1974 family pore-forming outer membrane protein [Methylomonas sp.]